jgi:hypothetical protein
VIITLQRLGLAIDTVRLLSVPGRRSGELRTTPVFPLTVSGLRYVVGLHDADWVKNARVAGWGVLTCGRNEERVALVELPPEERAPVLRAFPREVPHGVEFFVRLGIADSPDPEAFAAAAPRCAVFYIEG